MKLSEQEESALDYTQNIEEEETLKLLETGNAFSQMGQSSGDTKILEDLAVFIKTQNS